MDFTYEKLIAGNTSADSDSGSEVARKFNDNFEAVGNALSSLSDEKITAPVSAEVGQVIVVKAVDENGKPIEWEMANMSSGQVNKTISIIDITDNVVDRRFDFISAGPGLYFSSAEITFNFLLWDKNYETYNVRTSYSSGFFIVSHESDNGWRVSDIGKVQVYLQYGDVPHVDGCYDECICAVMKSGE